MENNTYYGLNGKLTAQEGRGQELAEILLEAAALMKSAKGCRLYSVAIDSASPEDVYVNEIWDSKEDHDNSLNIPGVRELIGRALPMLEGRPEAGLELKVLGGLGIK